MENTVCVSELLLAISFGNKEAYKELRESCRYLVISVANEVKQMDYKKYNLVELNAIFESTFTKALTTYTKNMDVDFRVFLRHLLRNDISRYYVKNYSSEVLTKAISLDQAVEEVGDGFYNKIQYTKKDDENKSYINVGECQSVISSYLESSKKRTELKKKIMKLKLQGYSLYEMSNELHVSIAIIRRVLDQDKGGLPLRDLEKRLK